MTISRRVFVKAGGLTLVSLGLDPLFLARAAFAARQPVGPSARPVLVCLFQRGAVDGLNMIVPHGEAAYYQERPRIAVPAKDVVDLDGHFGLHPSLAPLKELWDNKSLAAIHAIGSPDATRSHFDAQDYMESGTPGALAIDDLQAFGLRVPQEAARDRLTRAFEELYDGAGTGLLASSSREGFDAVQMLKRADPTQYRPDAGADYPPGRLGKTLLQIAQLIKADVGLEIAFADCSGWDTHVNQGSSEGQLSARLRELGLALAVGLAIGGPDFQKQ